MAEPINYAAIVDSLGLKQPWGDQPDLYWQGRTFQLVGRNHLIKFRRCILSMDKGLGKTSTILSIFEDPAVHQNTPGFTVVIFTTERGMEAYRRDIKKFPDHEDKIQLVYGSGSERELRWKNKKAKYFIATYAAFLSDAGARGEGSKPRLPQWLLAGQADAVVCDEFHRVFRNRTSKTFELFKRLFRHTKYFYPISGSAVSKGPQDLWPALHLCDQKFWGSYWKYVHTWCEVDDRGYGKSIIGPRSDRIQQWRNAVAPYVFHVTCEMVGDAMPPLNRDFLDIELPPEQRRIHDQMEQMAFMELADDEYIFAPNSLVKVHKLRMSLICPKVIDERLDVGQGIKEIYTDAKEAGLTRYVIFTPFRSPIPYLQDWLRNQGAQVFILQGGIGLDEQEKRLQDWRDYIRFGNDAETPGIIISTIKYGESWEVPEARYGYFLGEEWDPEDNKQAEARLHRLISIGPTFIQYCRFLNSYNEEMISQLVGKANNRKMLLETWGQLKRRAHEHK